ncbi:MAG: RelA/SpoT family protein [Muribaculaceae bacterium]|nr:RelA/SpoT family protein [Muribaculaceae bacterium]MDE6793406.1 RelA/SpoT family protein [Muribaculaceae bacterium]
MNRFNSISPAEEDLIIENAYQDVLRAYLASNHRRKVEIIERAFRFAKEAHRGVRRRSGEPYILHPIAVAQIVISELGLGSTSICAALLHDVVEDTEFSLEDIRNAFGDRIAEIVDGLTKISGGIFGDKASMQAENFKKLLLSMSNDIRVVLIKIADRLHNMRTLDSVSPEKQFKKAGETLYIYAPLAHRLGLFKIKLELEDLAFKYEHPQKYAEIMEKLSEGADHREEIVEKFVGPVRKKLDDAGFKYEIKARVKSAYSIFNKMRNKNIPFEEVYDVYAVRVIFENEDDALEQIKCWQIYTFFSEGHRLHPDRLRDWISAPKANGYRALHLTAMGPEGKWIEVQIRSRKMDEIAELGYAAHWKYKSGVREEESELDSWMNTIKDILAHPEPNAIDFLDTIKLNLFASEIYVFTPKGDLITLPAGATVLDFAFAIHTQLGTHCIAGKINHRLVPLSYKLNSGDQVEIITSDSQTPQQEWLEYCTSAKARTRIKTILRKDERQLIKRGNVIFNDLMESEGIEPSNEFITKVLANYRLKTRDELFLMLANDEINLSGKELTDIRSRRSSLWRKLLRNPFSLRKKNNKNSSSSDKREHQDGNEGSGNITVNISIEGSVRKGILEELTASISRILSNNMRSLNIEATEDLFRCKLSAIVENVDMAEEICVDILRIKGIKFAQRIS